MASWRRRAPVLHLARRLQVGPPDLLGGVVTILLHDLRLDWARRAPCVA